MEKTCRLAFQRLTLIAITLLLSLVSADLVRAAIIDCRRAAEGGAYTVYLDEPAYAQSVFRDDAQMRTFMDRLWFFLDQDRDRRWLEDERSPIGFAVCHGRQPSLDGREFDQPLVELLYNKGVILEVWGTLDAELHDGQLRDRQARIGYLLVPLEFIAPGGAGPAGKFFVRYPDPPGSAAEDFLDFFKNTTDIDAFIAVGLGVKALRSGDLELAQGNLCKAKLLLEQQAQSPNLPQRRKAGLLELARFSGSSAADAIRAAQQNLTHAGPLRLLDPDRPCPPEGSP